MAGLRRPPLVTVRPAEGRGSSSATRRKRQSRSRRSATAQCPGPIRCGPRLCCWRWVTDKAPGDPDAHVLGLERALRLVASLLAEAIGSVPPAGEPAWPGEPLT